MIAINLSQVDLTQVSVWMLWGSVWIFWGVESVISEEAGKTARSASLSLILVDSEYAFLENPQVFLGHHYSICKGKG